MRTQQSLSRPRVVGTAVPLTCFAAALMLLLPAKAHAAATNGNGTLFGLAVVPGGSGVYFVDDGTNTLKLLH